MPPTASLSLHSSSLRCAWERRVALLAVSVSLAFHAALLLGVRVQLRTTQAPSYVTGPTQLLRAVVLKRESGSILAAPFTATTSSATLVERTARQLKPLEDRQEEISSGDEMEQQTTAGASSTTPLAGARGSLFSPGLRDPRLFIAPVVPKPPAGDLPSPQVALEERLRAVHDSLEADKRSLPNMLARGYHPGGGRIMPEDGRIWEISQLLRQNQTFVRDSIREERIRATRERKNVERSGRVKP